MSLRDLIKSITGAKSSITELEQRVATLSKEREEIERRPPHRDDIIAWAVRGLDEADSHFFNCLRFHWKPEVLERFPGSVIGSESGPQILAMPVGVHQGSENIFLSPFGKDDWRRFTMGGSASPLMHFLRPLIEKEIPSLVDRCFPDANKGLKHADRIKRLEEIDAAISKAVLERDELLEQLQTAAAAAHRPKPIDQGTSFTITQALEANAKSEDPEARELARRALHR